MTPADDDRDCLAFVDVDSPFDDDDDSNEIECGRWANGRITPSCRLAGSEDCEFCPLRRARADRNWREGFRP